MNHPQRRRALLPLVLGLLLGAVALGSNPDRGQPPSRPEPTAELHLARRTPGRAPIRGNDFPDGVLALTWDDGPDAGTLELARVLHRANVSATFFVVAEWIDEVSDEPGYGTTTHATGYLRMPILGELAKLGHRIGSHTQNHALLGDAPAATITEQLGQSLRQIDPFVTSELRLFRPPGGSWSRASAAALTDPSFDDLVGPVLWDIDAKDWDGSLYCRSSSPPECEPGPIPKTSRVRADVMARRYLTRIEESRRGIVLLHDRVGDVGSRYALDVARRLIPELARRHFVFAAPVLAFSSMRERASLGRDEGRPLADVDGDGRADACTRTEAGIVCSAGGGGPLGSPKPWSAAGDFAGPGPLLLGDLNGDGRADACAPTVDGVACALSDGHAFKRATIWSPSHARELILSDVNGDGRVDLCATAGEKLECGLAP